LTKNMELAFIHYGRDVLAVRFTHNVNASKINQGHRWKYSIKSIKRASHKAGWIKDKISLFFYGVLFFFILFSVNGPKTLSIFSLCEEGATDMTIWTGVYAF